MQDKAELQKVLAKRKQQALQYVLEREKWSCGLQQKRKDHHENELEQLKQQLADSEARYDAARRALDALTTQRNSAQRRVETLQSSLASVTSRLDETRKSARAVGALNAAPSTRRNTLSLNRATAAAASVIAVATLLATVAFHEAQSNVKKKGQPDTAAVSALESVQVVNGERKSADDKKPAPQSGKGKTRFVKGKASTQRQWGPALFMTDANAVKPHVVFDPMVKEQQESLLTLGFDVGEADGFNGLRTRQAVEEFRSLYLSESGKHLQGANLAVLMKNYANLARSDSEKFGVDRGVVAAIRLSSVRTGVDFSYLMKLAQTESNFGPTSQAQGTSATGLYQFTHDTWLNTLNKHGVKYGLADYVAKIEFYVTRSGYQRPMVEDKAVYQHLLDLRRNPRVAAMMAAESVQDNKARLAYSFDRNPGQTDLYLSHFLGPDGAIAFLKARDENPDIFAVDMFPEAARSNHRVFHPKTCNPRTVDEVYELFGEKFSTRRFDDLAAY